MFPGFWQLLQPMWMWALPAALGVPLLAHLLSRHGGRLAAFPAVRFVSQAAADCARLLRPRHWLLLLMRALLLALVVLAFARPVWFRSAPAADPSQGVVAALILDRSASMTRTQRGSTLFDQAKRQLVETLSRLDPARDLATVIVMDGQPRALLPEPTASISGLIAMVQSVEPTQEHGDLEAALQLALSQMRESGRGGGENNEVPRAPVVEIYSDMQQTQWARLLRSASIDEAALHLHRIGEASDNVALFSPRINPVQPVAGQSATVSVEVANFSARATQVVVQARFGEETARQTVRLTAYGTLSVSFTITPTTVGQQVVELELMEHRDSMALDDGTAVTFSVAGARPVALISDGRLDDPQAASFYLVRALRPERDEAALSGVALRTWRTDQLGAALRGSVRPEVVVICEAQSLGGDDLRALHDYVRQGGGVLWIVDSAQAGRSLAQFSALGGEHPLSPIVPEDAGHWRSGANLLLAGGQFDEPMLAAFEGPSRGVIFNTRFAQVLAGRLPLAATPLLHFEDGTPALAVQWLGSGRVAVLAASLSPQDSEMVKGPLLVPLLHQVVRHLTPGMPVEGNPHPGSRPRVSVPGTWRDGELLAEDSQGRPLRVTMSQQIQGAAVVELERLSQVGRVTIHRVADGEPLAAIQVDLNPAESDMAVAEEEALAALTRPLRPLAAGEDDVMPAVTLRPAGVELWPYLVAAALLVATLEMLTLAAFEGKGKQASRNEATLRL